MSKFLSNEDTTYYFYILKCKDGTKYYGHTNNLVKRLREHIKGQVYSTRNKLPTLIYYEELNSRSESFKRERQFKNGRTRRETIEKMINSFPQAKCQGFNSQTSRYFGTMSYGHSFFAP
ncbi:MAG: GIY-YIG nuclease family protein [Candidatus Omnitrophica bacterium]|nr:GIY-YIG nuclease family protein [Candidatus Omnitrophota bacterium]